MKKKDITIYDLAAKLGISVTTVSRSLSGHESINKKTRQTVENLAREVGYQRNKFASNLRLGQTFTIGVIVPKLNSLFISSVLSGIEKVVNKSNYNLIICQSFEDETKEKNNIKTMFDNRVDALIVSLSTKMEDFTYLDEFLNKKVPIILFDRTSQFIPSTKVVIDNHKAGYIATEHLLLQGCRNIVHITGDLKHSVYKERLEGFKEALKAYGLEFAQHMLIDDQLTEIAIKNVLLNDILKREQRPDALFITNDSIAAYALVILKQQGIRVPKDIAIVGFNNDLISSVTEPAITTVNYPGFEMGETIGKTAIDMLANAKNNVTINKTIVLEADLIIRGSSLKK
ncbi:LacI family transcriptional regulator [Pedobacter frigiditerrae]|uniref:LacI family transcriptional regulator n=1 Tax=Pedobacter frigiditerrae TaxID=2530452 RepID=A0A4R0MP50_9SPHI|nr:LacI family DNA-binding transcriptional regulator [Pedobacter frigiditerrae]TCC88598.1 LacI family transcriptional regulator [Pedobacter frigiditerrae]